MVFSKNNCSHFSVTLYVRFALKFDQPIPLSVARLKQISQLTEIHHEALSSDKNGTWATQPLMELIIKNCTQGIMNYTFKFRMQ